MQPINSNQRRSEIQFARVDGKKGEIAYVDKNGNGRYDADQDQVVVLDVNGDNRYDSSDAEMTARLLRHQSRRNTPLENLDPEAAGLHNGLDRNGDGVLDSEEVGNRTQLMVDRDGDGRFSQNERALFSEIDRLAGGEIWHHTEIPSGFGPSAYPNCHPNPSRPLVVLPKPQPFNPTEWEPQPFQ